MSISVGHQQFNYQQCPNLNLREISESESESNSTHVSIVSVDDRRAKRIIIARNEFSVTAILIANTLKIDILPVTLI